MTDIDESEKRKIAVIGDSDFRLGFKLAGVKEVFDKENYEEKIQRILEDDEIGILVVKEEDLEVLSKRVRNEVGSSVNPVVVSLSEDAESERLQDKIKKAIGADITG